MIDRERGPHALRWILALSAAALAVGAACSSGGGGGNDPVLEEGPPFTVSGTIIAATGSAADSDTNDLFAPFAANDSAATAQEIPNPVTLGGHVNAAGAKPPGAPDGRTTSAGDPEDWYRVSLAAGQSVRLRVAEDGSDNDLDLELRMLDETLVADSTGPSRSEEISVAATDEYYLVVVAVQGFSNYTLTIGRTPTGSAGPAIEPTFVPGEVIVRYHDGAAGRLGATSGPARAERAGMRYVAGAAHGPMLFAARTAAQRRAAFHALGLAATPRHGLAPDSEEGETSAEDTRRLVAALRARPDVRSADLNYLRQATLVPDDEFYPFQWHYEQINLPAAWEAVDPNGDVVVAVLDTGVKAGHPDLAPQLVPGHDFILDPEMANDGDGCDADPDDPGDSATPGGSSYHGTHVIGTVAARTSFQGGNADGVAGVAWNARVMPLRVLGVRGGTDFDIMSALNYAADRDNTCGVRPGFVAPIVNMSLGGPDFNQTFQDLLTELRDDVGMIFVAAAGNESSSEPFYPAAYDGVISVSATGPSKTLAPYSNFGSTIDVAAPGGDFSRDIDGDGFPDGVLSTFFDEANGSFGYAFYEGTSMAAPHVSGVLALMLDINAMLTPFDIDNALIAGDITDDIGSSQFFGHGLIDAARAVNLAAAGGGGAMVVDPFLRVDPDGLNYGFLAVDFVLTASNGGNDEAALSVDAVSATTDDGASWLTVVPDAVDAQNLGEYRALVNRNGLDDGLYTATITFTSSANEVDVPVIMQVGDPADAQADAGHHFVLLVEPGTLETVAAFEVDPTNGLYPFAFGEVQTGDYILVAGTDSDGDLFICDPGEACGGFPTTESPTPIGVGSDVTGLEFVTGFAGGGVGPTGVGGDADGGYATEVGVRPER